METSNSPGGPVQGTSTNDNRRKYNFTAKKRKKKKMKTMMDVLRNAKKNN